MFATLSIDPLTPEQAVAQLYERLDCNTWLETIECFNDACAYCLRTDRKLEMEHIVAISRSGPDVAVNIVPSCHQCNCLKLNRPVFVMIEPMGYWTWEKTLYPTDWTKETHNG